MVTEIEVVYILRQNNWTTILVSLVVRVVALTTAFGCSILAWNKYLSAYDLWVFPCCPPLSLALEQRKVVGLNCYHKYLIAIATHGKEIVPQTTLRLSSNPLNI